MLVPPNQNKSVAPESIFGAISFFMPNKSTTMSLLWPGGYLHINGIGERVGGFGETQNFLTGPPPTLPLMVLAMSVLGLLALYWR